VERVGYGAVVANAETMNLGRLFDLVVAADVLDHLANPARFLEAVHEHLRADGLLAIVTPNAMSLNHALKSLAAVRIEANPEHTCWYDRTTLGQLLACHGFEATEEYWQDYQTRPHTNLVRLRRNLATHLIVIARPLATGAGQ